MFWNEKLRALADFLLFLLFVSNLWLSFIVYGARDLIYVNQELLVGIRQQMSSCKK